MSFSITKVRRAVTVCNSNGIESVCMKSLSSNVHIKNGGGLTVEHDIIFKITYLFSNCDEVNQNA